MTTSPDMCRRIVLLHFVIISVLMLPAGCSPSATQAMTNAAGETSTKESTAGPPPQPPAPVRVTTIRQESIAPEFRALGNVRPLHVSIVASGADGIVDKFPIEVGHFIDKGTMLSELKMEATNRDLAEQEAVKHEREAELEEISTPRKEDEDEARARKSAADVAFANAERRLEELRALNKRGAANQSEVKDAQEALDAAEQTRLAAIALLSKISNPRPETVRQAAARLDAQNKHIEFLEAERDKRTTSAPFAGFVVEVHTYVGQWLSKGDPVVTLAELEEVEVEVQIDQQYIDQIAPGREVTLKIQGSGSRDGLASPWNGKVHSVVPRSKWQNGSRSFPVIVRVPNVTDRTKMPPVPALREGMMAEVTFQGEPIDAVLVPKDSMVRGSDGMFIYIVNPLVEGQPLSVRPVAVRPGLGSGTWIQVTGENIAAGMQVVTEGAERMRPLQTVQILPNPADDSAVGESDAAK